MSVDPVTILHQIRLDIEKIETTLTATPLDALDAQLIEIYKRFLPLMSISFRPDSNLKAAPKNQGDLKKIQDCFTRCTTFLKSKTWAASIPSLAPTLTSIAPTWFAYKSTTDEIVKAINQGWDDVPEELKGAAHTPRHLTASRLAAYDKK